MWNTKTPLLVRNTTQYCVLNKTKNHAQCITTSLPCTRQKSNHTLKTTKVIEYGLT